MLYQIHIAMSEIRTYNVSGEMYNNRLKNLLNNYIIKCQLYIYNIMEQTIKQEAVSDLFSLHSIFF